MIKTEKNEMIVSKTKLGFVDWFMICTVSCVNITYVGLMSYELFNF